MKITVAVPTNRENSNDTMTVLNHVDLNQKNMKYYFLYKPDV